MLGTLAALVLTALLAAGCGGDPGGQTTTDTEDAQQTTTTDPTETDADGDQEPETGVNNDDEQAGDAAEDTDGGGDEPGTDDGSDNGDDEGRKPVASPRFEGEDSKEGWRLAPAGDDRIVMLWDESGATVPGHTGNRSEIVAGPFFEIAYTTQGVVYQRPGADPWIGDPVIRLDTGDGKPRILVEAGEGEHLHLEGAVELDDRVEVYYQLRSGTTPETARGALHRLPVDATGTVGPATEIMTTGGWESATTFATIRSYPVAVALRGAEAEIWFQLVDLDDGFVIYESDRCLDGEGGCRTYEVATVLGGDDGPILGLRPVWNEEAGWIDAYGLFRFDPDSETDTMLARFEWDNGLWYPESILALDDSTLAVSLRDGDHQPLPALVVELGDGNEVAVATLPEPGFVRWFDLT